MSWKKYLVDAFKQIGGEGHYSDIYKAVENLKGKDNLTSSWKASVRGAIETYSKDSEKYNGKDDLFYSVNGIGKGIWGLNNYEDQTINVDLTEDDIGFPEGKEVLRKHIVRERNPKLIRLAKENFKSTNGMLFCEICGFNFEEEYGEIGKGFIEGHHSIPISDLKHKEETKVEDIVMVCSNCHKMLHRKRPWLSKNELKKIKTNL